MGVYDDLPDATDNDMEDVKFLEPETAAGVISGLMINNSAFVCPVHGDIGYATMNVSVDVPGKPELERKGDWCLVCLYDALNAFLMQVTVKGDK